MSQKMRYSLLDVLRGFSLLSMIAYHVTYDLVAIYGVNLPWYFDLPGYIWQQSICWGFILLSGICWNFGRSPLRRGLIISACGLIITVVTSLVMPSQRIVMGVLSFLGAATLLMIPVSHILNNVNPRLTMGVSALLFVLTRNINRGFLGFEAFNLIRLSQMFYTINGGSILGFPAPNFYSSDYFSIFPWFFLFSFGCFLWKSITVSHKIKGILTFNLPPFSALGRRSLVVYLLHQPLIMLVLKLIIN